MNLNDCITFANENPLCSLATAENDQPRVRLIGLWFADETGFYFQTSTFKEIPHQLRSNPKTEVCFYKQEGIVGTMLRISGEVEFLDDLFYRTKAIADRPFLESLGFSKESPNLILFRMAHGQAHFWTMESNLKGKEKFVF